MVVTAVNEVLYAFPSVCGLIVSSYLAIRAWQRGPAPATLSFLAFMLGVATWSLTSIFVILGTGLETKILWDKLQYVGIGTVGVAWLALVLLHTGNGSWLTRRNVLIASVVPLVSFGLAATNERHQIFYRGAVLGESHGTPFLDTTIGPGYLLEVAYLYALFTVAAVLLVRDLVRALPAHRGQTLALLVSAIIVGIAGAVDALSLNPVPQVDLTVTAFVLTSMVLLWSVHELRFLEIVPIARDTVVEGMNDGVIVLDARDQVLDVNHAAERILGRPAKQLLGATASDVFPAWRDLRLSAGVAEDTRTEIAIGSDGALRHFELRVSPLLGRRKALVGHVVIARDVSERKETEEKLRFLSGHDPLTGLRNRLSFETELARLERSFHYPVSIVMLDLDGLKGTNDAQGHSAGDVLLRRTADILESSFRLEDVVARVGGDEFSVLLPNTSALAAEKALARVRGQLEADNDRHPEAPLRVSIGVATADSPRSLDEVWKVADALMYAQKAGRKS